MLDDGRVARMLRSRPYLIHEAQPFVAKLAVEIGHRLDLAPQHLDEIRLCALLHDIGQLTVPRQILCSPTRLSPQEFDIVRKHCKAGSDLLKDSGYPSPAVRVALEHHERLDGSGYPQGLRADEICLEARIVAVADVAEAMTADRPYRPSLGLGAALEELSKGRCVRYDREVVDACTDLLSSTDFVRRWHNIE